MSELKSNKEQACILYSLTVQKAFLVSLTKGCIQGHSLDHWKTLLTKKYYKSYQSNNKKTLLKST